MYTIEKVKSGILEKFSFKEWLYDGIISGFVGFLTYELCKYAMIDERLTAVLIGISAHQGARGLAFIENLITKKIKSL